MPTQAPPPVYRPSSSGGITTPPPRKRRRWPWVLGLVAVLLMGTCTGVILANSSNGNKPTAAVSTPAPVQAAVQHTPTSAALAKAAAPTQAPAAPKPAAPASCQAPCANVNGWIVQVSNVRYSASSGNQFETPEQGNVYVEVDVTFVNKTSQEQNANPFNFVLQDASGIKHTEEFLTSCGSWSAVNLTAGSSFGPKCLAFQATAGKPSPLTLVFTPDLFGGDHNIKIA